MYSHFGKTILSLLLSICTLAATLGLSRASAETVARILPYNGVPTLFINGEPTPHMALAPIGNFLCSPSQYEAQAAGEPGLFQSGYFGSYRLHNKIFWQEADIRTHLVDPPDSFAYTADDLRETLGLMGREFGNALAEMNGLWWFTLAGDHTFRDKEIMDRVARFSNEASEAVKHRGSRRTDAAVFHSEDAYCRMKWGPGAITYPLVTDMRRKLSRAGVPVDYYLLSDIADANLPDYKLYVFLNPFYLTDELREAIARKVRRNNAVAVWFYAPGFIREDGSFSEEGIESLTGIRVRHVRRKVKLGLDVANLDHPITAGLQGKHIEGSWKNHPVDPVFFADDPSATVLGRLTPGGDAGLAGPDVEGVVLDPAGARVVLRELLLGDGHDGAASVEDDRPRARRALVEGEDVALHSFSGSVSLTRA